MIKHTKKDYPINALSLYQMTRSSICLHILSPLGARFHVQLINVTSPNNIKKTTRSTLSLQHLSLSPKLYFICSSPHLLLLFSLMCWQLLTHTPLSHCILCCIHPTHASPLPPFDLQWSTLLSMPCFYSPHDPVYLHH